MVVQLSDHLERLQSLDNRYLCGLAHENSCMSDPSLCSTEVQNRCLCCAHSGQKVIAEAIDALESGGYVSRLTAEQLRVRLREQTLQLLSLDMCASREYGMQWEIVGHADPLPVNHDILLGQYDAVSALDGIRQEIIDLCVVG